MMKSLIFLLPLFFLLLIIGCAGGDSPVIPDQSEKITSLPVENILSSDRHTLLGKWDLNFILEEQLAIVSEYRDSETHYNVTTVIPTPEIIINSFDPLTNIIDVDVTISNPFPIDVYDVRLIIFTDSAGHMLQNDDGWTSLYDIHGGLPVNPFRAYAETVPDRKFVGQTEYTENLLILLPGGNPNVTFAIDASYPGNCQEPYKFGSLSQDILYDEIGSSALIQVGVYDHQNNVNAVNLYCPVITGTDLVPFTYTGFNGWKLELINNTGADPGEYEGWLIAASSDSAGLALYKPVDIIVSRLTTGWAQSISADENWSKCVHFDGDKNLYITGTFLFNTDFDPGIDEDIHYSSGCYDIYLTKYDYDGNFDWARTWGGSPNGIEAGYGVTTDMNGDVFVTGHFIGEPDFDPGPDETIVASNGHKDVFLSKFDDKGTFQWVLTWGGSERGTDYNFSDIGFCVISDNSDNIYVGGNFWGTVDFDPGLGVDLHSSNGWSDIFLSKFDTKGVFKWALTWGGGSDDGYLSQGFDLAIDEDLNIVVTGMFNGTVDLDPGPGDVIAEGQGGVDVFLSKFDPSGNLIWATNWGGRDGDHGRGVDVCDLNNIYVSGSFGLTVDFDPTSKEEIHTTDGFDDSYLSKFTSDGRFRWVRVWGSSELGLEFYDAALDVAVYGSDEIYVTG